MGGKIEVQSTPGQGTTFAFGVPLEAATGGPALALAEPAAELAGARVLVVDDNATNRLILRRLLTPYGALVTEVDGGEAGLAALRAARAAHAPYDLLLLDQQMPDLDGLQLVARVRAEAPDGAPGDAGAAVARAILMLSSDQRIGDAARAQALGITRYLVKPVKRAALLATIVATLRQHATPAGMPVADAAAAPPEGRASTSEIIGASGLGRVAPPRRLRLLLVDDSADNRRLVQLYLSRLPYVLESVVDGQAGLDAFTTGAYDLVLMDIHMPVMDGLTATRTIRAWERERCQAPTPVVALTASAMAEDIRQALAAGCDVHLAKPLKKTTLLAALLRLTAQAAGQAVPAA
jgi:two-component system sensor histidine kinase/response regulator